MYFPITLSFTTNIVAIVVIRKRFCVERINKPYILSLIFCCAENDVGVRPVLVEVRNTVYRRGLPSPYNKLGRADGHIQENRS